MCRADGTTILDLGAQSWKNPYLVPKWWTITIKEIETKRKKQPLFSKDAILWEATRKLGEEYEKLYVHWLTQTMKTIESDF